MFFTITVTRIQAQTTLTFQEAIKIGLEKNVNLATQNNNLFTRQARKTQAMAAFLPNLTASGFLQRTDGLQIDPTSGRGGNVTSDYIQGTISSSLVLFSGFSRLNTLRSSNDDLDAQEARVNRSRQDVIFNVAQQYLQVLLDQELLRIATENLKAQQSLLEQITGQVEVGVRPVTDQYNQDAAVQTLNLTVLRARNTLENDRAILAQTLQLDPSKPLDLVTPDWTPDTDLLKEKTPDELYTLALASRTDYLEQQKLLESAHYSYRTAANGFYPTLSLFVSYGSTYYANDSWKLDPSTPRPESFSRQFGTLNPTLAYGVNLSIPIFDRLRTRTARVESRVLQDNSKLTLENLEKSIKIDVKRTYNNYINALESYKASIIQFDAATLALQTQRESYDLGASAQVALAQATSVFMQAEGSKAQAQISLQFQKILLDYALGTIKEEDIK